MAQGFYTLEEAANLLGKPPEELNRMAQSRKIRAFADRGTWRFRSQDIDEMVRQQDGSSDDHLAAGDPLDDPPAAPRTSGLLNNPPAAPRTGGILDEPPAAPRTSGLLNNPPAAPRTSGLLNNPPAAPRTGGILDEPPAAPRTGGILDEPPAAFGDDDLIPFDADLDLDVKPGSGVHHPKTDEDLIPIDDLLDNPPSPGASAVNLGADLPRGTTASQVGIASKASTLKPGSDSDVRLVMGDSGSEFELTMDSSPALEEAAAELPPASAPRVTGGPLTPDFDADLPPLSALDSDPDPGLAIDLAPEPAPVADLSSLPPADDGHDSDVRVDFDGSSIDDSMVSMGEPRQDSDVRLDPAGISHVSGNLAPPVESLLTEEIDLDAELQQADDASQERRGKTKPAPGASRKSGTPMPPGPTQLPGPPKGTMLPTSSPFELSEDDLEFSGTSDSNANRPLGSEFELTLAPEEEPSPLNLGDDEDVDLGGLPPKDGAASSSARSELSGINLHDPADSGISLEKGDNSESVDFELTVDDDMAGPKTLKGKMPDSDSEFELTLEDDSGESLPGLDAETPNPDGGDQKDIFETDIELPALDGEDSRSEAVALDGSDTDLESSDFDLAVSDTDLDRHAAAGADDSDSEVVVLPDADDDSTPAKKKSRVTGGNLDSADELLLDDGLETESDDDDEVSPAAQTIPAAQAEWGLFPILLLVPTVLVMFLAGLMSYEMVHGMWGYHTSTKPSGLVVRGIAGLFVDKLPDE